MYPSFMLRYVKFYPLEGLKWGMTGFLSAFYAATVKNLLIPPFVTVMQVRGPETYASFSLAS